MKPRKPYQLTLRVFSGNDIQNFQGVRYYESMEQALDMSWAKREWPLYAIEVLNVAELPQKWNTK